MNGEVLEMASFLAHHPGGAPLLLAVAGSDASQFFNSEKKHK